jgi:hypothetical protein
MGLLWFDEQIHHKVRKYCEKFRLKGVPTVEAESSAFSMRSFQGREAGRERLRKL